MADTRHNCIECGYPCTCGTPDECQLCVDCYEKYEDEGADEYEPLEYDDDE